MSEDLIGDVMLVKDNALLSGMYFSEQGLAQGWCF
ncbi:hypothetical protein ABID99_001540 [Mucilaginibacter sp. OAE612]|jgi:hypothetical protein